MSRIAKNPIELPKAVQLSQDGQTVRVKGPKGELALDIHPTVQMSNDDGVLTFAPAETIVLVPWPSGVGSTQTPCAESIRGLAQPFQPVVEAPLAYA